MNDILHYFTENSTIRNARIKKLLIENNIKEYKCECCQLDSWNGQNITLELDHINGINNDNRLDNLRLLCPNCHSQTPTFRGRGRNGRKEKKIFNDSEFIEIVKRSTTYKQVCIELGIVSTGPNNKTIKKRMNELNITLKSKNIDISKYYCKCGEKKNVESSNCIRCSNKKRRKVKRPPYEQLLKEVQDSSYVAMGKKYGVSDNAIRKWLNL